VFGLVDDCLDRAATPARQQSGKIHIVYDRVGANHRKNTIRVA
jgi:hypothetical protein